MAVDVAPLAAASRELSAADFVEDSHAAKYRDEFARHPEALLRLLSILNDPENERRLADAEMHGLPALCGVTRFIEADPVIRRVLADNEASLRLRQTVGVAVKLKMAKLGWRPTGRKGATRGSQHFTRAEHYAADDAVRTDPSSRALAALDAVAAIGSDEEREETSRQLMEALAASRQAEGRPF